MKFSLRTNLAVVACAFAAFLITGCGSGGRILANLAGVVTDVDGSAVAGARVAVGSRATTSLSNGSFQISDVGDGFRLVKADIDIRGQHWSGETMVDLSGGEQNRNTNIVVSDDRFQGAIAGSVIAPTGFGLARAKVFIGGPVSSTLALTDDFGNYQALKLTPGTTYTVTASLAGFVNDTRQVHVDAGLTTAASFALQTGSSQGSIPAPQNVVTQAWTVADSVSRSGSSEKGLFDWLKRLYRQKKGLRDGPQARTIDRKSIGRAFTGSVIEVDLFWDYQSFDDFFGYAVERGTTQNNLAVVAVARDPLTRVFFDLDSALLSDVPYYYSVHRLDTIDFPATGAIGPGSAVVSSNPLQSVHTLNPGPNATVSGDPLFQWTAVNGAARYQIYLFDRFPDLQSSTDPNGVVSIWQGGSSLVQAPQTSQQYNGPALQSGHTYYWLVVASDTNDTAFSATVISKFTKH